MPADDSGNYGGKSTSSLTGVFMASPGCGLKALSLEIGQALADEWMSSSLKLQPNLDGKASFDRLLRRIGFFIDLSKFHMPMILEMDERKYLAS